MERGSDWHGGRDPTTYFTAVAAEYAAYRPTYPPVAFETMQDGLVPPVRAVDVGCGTGISTRLLAQAGALVVGLDPNEAMLQHAIQQRPSSHSIVYRVGNAERTGLADGSADLVLCAQSFHWFEAKTALREFHRILRPGGRLALLWNVREMSDEFSAGYELVSQHAEDAAERDGRIVRRGRDADPTEGGFFSNAAWHSFANPQRLTLGELLGRARSASYFPRHEPLRSKLERSLRELFAEFSIKGEVILMQRAELTLATRC